ncbi:phosphohistidine phosphatase SixA [Planctobacterium marinum]
MQLFLMRHGEAENSFSNDAQRSLTTQGFIESQKAGVWLNDTVNHIDYALVSPFKRARQTYEMVQSITTVAHTEFSEDIIPSGSVELVHDYIQVLAQERNLKSLIVVSHMPLVSYLVDSFCGQLRSILFTTASVARLDYDIEANKAVFGELYLPEK